MSDTSILKISYDEVNHIFKRIMFDFFLTVLVYVEMFLVIVGVTSAHLPSTNQN